MNFLLKYLKSNIFPFLEKQKLNLFNISNKRSVKLNALICKYKLNKGSKWSFNNIKIFNDSYNNILPVIIKSIVIVIIVFLVLDFIKYIYITCLELLYNNYPLQITFLLYIISEINFYSLYYFFNFKDNTELNNKIDREETSTRLYSNDSLLLLKLLFKLKKLDYTPVYLKELPFSYQPKYKYYHNLPVKLNWKIKKKLYNCYYIKELKDKYFLLNSFSNNYYLNNYISNFLLNNYKTYKNFEKIKFIELENYKLSKSTSKVFFNFFIKNIYIINNIILNTKKYFNIFSINTNNIYINFFLLEKNTYSQYNSFFKKK